MADSDGPILVYRESSSAQRCNSQLTHLTDYYTSSGSYVGLLRMSLLALIDEKYLFSSVSTASVSPVAGQ